jgi:hypothetical protein
VKLRHAAALALVGWYLMVPPQKPDGHLDASAPLSKWKIGAAFDNGDAQKCNEMIAVMEAHGLKLGVRREIEEGSTAQCVSSDDPRLAR